MVVEDKVLYTFTDGTEVTSLAVWGSEIYFTATDHVVRKLTETGDGRGNIDIVAGTPGERGHADGLKETARFNSPHGIAVCDDGSLIIADSGNRRIRKISPDGVVTTVAGSGVFGFADGSAAEAQFRYPFDVAVHTDGSIVVTDSADQRIRLISPLGVVTTLAGSGAYGFADGSAAEAKFRYPYGVAVCPDGAVLVCDSSNHRIRRIAAGSSAVSTVAGSEWAPGHLDGIGGAATFRNPNYIAVDTTGHAVVGESDGYIRKIKLATGEVTTVGNGFGPKRKLAIDKNSNIVFSLAGASNTILRLTGSLGIGPGFRSAPLPLWKPTRQMMMQSPVWTRDCVIVIMLISERVRRSQGTSQGTNLPSLPNEMWFAILRTMPSCTMPSYQIGVPEVPEPILWLGDPSEDDSD